MHMSSSDPHRVMEREQLHQRAHPDRLGDLRRGGDEHLLVGSQAQIGAVVLCQAASSEAGLVGWAFTKSIRSRSSCCVEVPGIPSMWSKIPNVGIAMVVSSASSSPWRRTAIVACAPAAQFPPSRLRW